MTARDPARGSVSAGVAVVAGVVVLLAGAAVLVVGAGRGDEGPTRAPRAPATTTPARAADTAVATTRSAGPSRPTSQAERAAGVREVLVPAPADDRFPSPVVVDELEPRVVLRVAAVGFEPDRRGSVRQCVRRGAGDARCGNRFPVQFDADGTARFQYLIGARIGDPEAARPACVVATTTCSVRLTDGETTAVVDTVFGGPAPRSRAVVAPAPDAVDVGDRLRVTLAGFAPGARVRVALCAAPTVSGTRRCGGDGGEVHVPIGGDGTGRGSMVVADRLVGSERVRCGRATPCAIVVQATGGATGIVPVPLAFAAGPGASYDAGRVVLAAVLVAVLLVAAGALYRTTDWRKPSEAETPDMDSALLDG